MSTTASGSASDGGVGGVLPAPPAGPSGAPAFDHACSVAISALVSQRAFEYVLHEPSLFTGIGGICRLPVASAISAAWA
jgi:hypothetical protein